VDIYSIFKFLHVICAIAWVGGGLTLLANSILSARAKGEMETLKSLDTMNNLGKTWFIPASLATVVFGVIAAILSGSILQLWVLLGLAGFASTFLTGILFLEPTGRKIAELLSAGRTEEALEQGKRLMQIAKFDYTVMVVVIADMVFKPYWTDVLTIIVFAAAIGAGAFFFLYGGKLPVRQQVA
jgi:uncharacterized membrane protein